MATFLKMNQNKHKRKYSIYDVAELLLFPFCGLMILYYLIKPLIITFEYIRVVQYILLIVCVTLFALYITAPNTEKKLYKENREWTILKWIFTCYWSAYMVLQLDAVSIYYNYLMVLLYGLVVGYRLRKSR